MAVGDRSASDRAWSLDLPHNPHGAREGRQFFAAVLVDLLPGPVLTDAIAVVAELLGNAVRHARALPGDLIRLSWGVDEAATGHTVWMQVVDGGAAQGPVARDASPDAVDGRGLAIVTALARRWGVEPAEGGQCVWAELGPATI